MQRGTFAAVQFGTGPPLNSSGLSLENAEKGQILVSVLLLRNGKVNDMNYAPAAANVKRSLEREPRGGYTMTACANSARSFANFDTGISIPFLSHS
jgi:hypothetical protein